MHTNKSVKEEETSNSPQSADYRYDANVAASPNDDYRAPSVISSRSSPADAISMSSSSQGCGGSAAAFTADDASGRLYSPNDGAPRIAHHHLEVAGGSLPRACSNSSASFQSPQQQHLHQSMHDFLGIPKHELSQSPSNNIVSFNFYFPLFFTPHRYTKAAKVKTNIPRRIVRAIDPLTLFVNFDDQSQFYYVHKFDKRRTIYF